MCLHSAKWSEKGAAAGRERNTRIANTLPVDIVLAVINKPIEKSIGTNMCLNIIKTNNKNVKEFILKI